MKGQISIEFLASFFIYVLAVGAVLNFVSGNIPAFADAMDQKELHYDAKYVSDHVLTQKGYHTFGTGGSNWEKNSSTQNSVKNFGLATDYLVVGDEKLNSIATTGQDKFNYTEFINAVGTDNNYLFNFTWLPIVHASGQYPHGQSPPGITPPTAGLYDSAEHKVHYGNIHLNGQTKYFLITSHLSSYNTTYVSNSRDFTGSVPRGTEDTVNFNGKIFQIKTFQNLRYDKGGLLVLQSHVKEFGSTLERDESWVKINRYVSYNSSNSELEPMKVEVYAW